jgi:hypothetical protein
VLGLIVAVYAYVLFVERRSLSSIGFRRLRWLDIVLGVVTSFSHDGWYYPLS